MQKKNRFLAMLLTSTLAAGMIAGSFGVEVSAAETSELTKSVYTQTADKGVISDADINVTEKTVGNKSFKIEETLSSKKVTAQKPKQDIFAAYPDADLKAKKSKQLNKETVEEGDFVYVVNDDGTLMVSSYSGSNSIVNIPEQVNGREVTSIENGAFYGDDTIKEINIPKTIKGVEISWGREYYTDEEDTEWYYDCCGSKNDYDDYGVLTIPDTAPFYACSYLEKINVDPENPYYKSIDGVLFTYVKYMGNQEGVLKEDLDKLVLVQYPDGKQDFEYYIPEDTVYIGSSFDKNNDDDIEYHVFSAFGFYYNQCTYKIHCNDSIKFIGNRELYWFLGIMFGRENSVSYNFAKSHWILYCVTGAENPNDEFNFEYMVSDMYSDDWSDGAVIMKYVGNDPVVEIPDEINGLVVNAIHIRSFLQNQVVTEATLPKTVSAVEIYNTVYDYDGSQPLEEVACISAPYAPMFIDCPNLKKINVQEGSDWYNSIDGVLYAKNEEKENEKFLLLTYPQGRTDENYVVPSGVWNIGYYIFAWGYTIPDYFQNAVINNQYLKKITIPQSVESIIAGEFKGCDLTIRGYDGSNAYRYARDNNIPFESMDLDPTVDYSDLFEYVTESDHTIKITKYIGNETYLYIPRYIETLPVTVISSNAFENCPELKYVFLPRTFQGVEIINTLTQNVDVNSELMNASGVTVKKHIADGSKEYTTVTAVDASPFGNCPKLQQIDVDENNEYYYSEDGILYTYGKYASEKDENAEKYYSLVLLKYPQNHSGTVFSVPDYVTHIGTGNRYNEFIKDPYNANAFYGCKNLKEVTLPKEVTYIHEGEFSDNKVTLYVSKDSYAHKYAVDHELKYEVIHIPGDVDITVYGESQAVFTVEHQDGIAGVLFNIYYDSSQLMFKNITGIDENKYSIIAKDDQLGKITVDVISLTENCDTSISAAFNFDIIKDSVGVNITSEICELINKDLTEISDPDKYGKLTIDGIEPTAVSDTDVDYTLENENGIGGALFKVHYDNSVFEYTDISGYDSDQYSVIVNDDKLGTVTVNAICLTEECPDKVSFVLHFKVINNNTYSYEAFSYELIELIDKDANDVNDKQKYGDVNNDGKISSKDSMLVQRYVIQLEALSAKQQKNADVDLDGKVTSKDALYILQASINMRTLPVAK